MLREIITIIVIIVSIFVGDYVTDRYTTKSTDSMINLLSELHIEGSLGKEKMNQINERWDEIKDKMAYYIEHDELEKVENDLKAIESAIEMDEEDEGEIYINQCKFVLKHIKEKYEFNLQNIF